MKIVQKYLIKEILRTFGLILLAIMVFILINNLVDEMGMMMQHKPPAYLLALYFLFKMPFLLAESTPFALLLSILFVFSQFNRFNELLAMKSVGIGFSSLAVPVLILAALISVCAILFNETVVSAAYDQSKYIKDTLIEKKSGASADVRYDLAKLGAGGRIFYIQKFDGLLGAMSGICILKVDKDFGLLERLDAKEGTWMKDRWVLKNGASRTFVNNTEKTVQQFASYDLFIKDTPEDFIVTRRSPEDTLTVNIFRLIKLINLLKDSGFDYQEEAVNLHLKFAFPFATFILALLGISIPFIFHAQKSFVNAALGFVVTVIASFFYMGFVTIGLSVGKVGVLPPIVAAWLGNIVFAIIGFGVLYKVRK
jgi:lipopolysaccharide export system permease protein